MEEIRISPTFLELYGVSASMSGADICYIK